MTKGLVPYTVNRSVGKVACELKTIIGKVVKTKCNIARILMLQVLKKLYEKRGNCGNKLGNESHESSISDVENSSIDKVRTKQKFMQRMSSSVGMIYMRLVSGPCGSFYCMNSVHFSFAMDIKECID